jgi:hypothetical protein
MREISQGITGHTEDVPQKPSSRAGENRDENRTKNSVLQGFWTTNRPALSRASCS